MPINSNSHIVYSQTCYDPLSDGVLIGISAATTGMVSRNNMVKWPACRVLISLAPDHVVTASYQKLIGSERDSICVFRHARHGVAPFGWTVLRRWFYAL